MSYILKFEYRYNRNFKIFERKLSPPFFLWASAFLHMLLIRDGQYNDVILLENKRAIFETAKNNLL